MTAPWMPPLPEPFGVMEYHRPIGVIGRLAGYTADQMRRAQADAARAALEAAAKVCEPSNADRPDDWTEYARTRAECAGYIRALAKEITP